MIVIGIDPGASGGIVYLDTTSRLINGYPTKDEKDTASFLQTIKEKGRNSTSNVFAYIEKVHAMPGNGVSSMFSFGQSYGFLRGCLVSQRIPFLEVSPQTWMKSVGISKREKSESKSQFKRRLQAKARQLFPSMKIPLTLADAVLIAYYGSTKSETL